ncbi:MAG: (2Fe-2S)-binding protein [Gordonia sp. (in: high G+C Gram-positive bacteria)]
MTAAAFSDLGPFFAVDIHVRGQAPTSPFSTLAASIAEPAVFDERVSRVRAALAAGAAADVAQVQTRVAASVTHLGLIARVLAPAIAASAEGGALTLAAADIWWCDQLGGPFPVSMTWADSVPATLGVVDDLGELFTERYGISPRIVGGNVASAANSAARMIATSAPTLSASAHRAADDILRRSHVEDGILRAGTGFRRRSCCLIYRVAGTRAAVCGDCVLGG